MKRFTLFAFLLPLLFACERKEQSASTAPASAPATQSSPQPAPPAASTEPGKTAPAASAPEPAKPASGQTSGSSAGSASGSSGNYTVAAGDTLSDIARKHGVSRDDLAKWNNIKDPNRIHPGQTLKLSESGS
jgi:LysM repeat protein